MSIAQSSNIPQKPWLSNVKYQYMNIYVYVYIYMGFVPVGGPYAHNHVEKKYCNVLDELFLT